MYAIRSYYDLKGITHSRVKLLPETTVKSIFTSSGRVRVSPPTAFV